MLYFPITLAVFLVIDACKQSDPRKVLSLSVKNWAILTLVLVIGCFAVMMINKFA